MLNTCKIVDLKPTVVEELYLNKDCNTHVPHRSHSSFFCEVSNCTGDLRSFIVKTIYEIRYIDRQLASRLVTRTEFLLVGLKSNDESLDTLEQCVYIAYSDMLKMHKERYRSWESLQQDINLPDEQDVRNELNNLIITLPY